MSKPLVLITGGTSRTGIEVAKHLLATQKFRVRLGARDPSKLDVSHGAEPVVLNSTLDSMRAALKGVNSVFFIYPVLVGVAVDALVANFFQAVRETLSTLTHIVYLSTMRAAPDDEEFEVAYKHYRNEQQLIHSGIPFTILRPTYFHENTVATFADSIKLRGEIQTSARDGVWTSVAISDVAAVALAAMTMPTQHAGKTYALREEAVTDAQVAEKISRVIGKKVKVVNLTPEEHVEVVTKGPEPVDAMAAHVVRADKEKRDGQFAEVTPDLEILLGRKGVSLDEFLAEHADDFM